MEILKENFEHCDDNLYIAFDRQNEKLLCEIFPWQMSREATVLVNVRVEFEVKHSYFNTLIRAVNTIQPAIVDRILPSKEDFRSFSTISKLEFEKLLLLPETLGMHLDQCQRSALENILASDPRSPPILVTGSFGTGKTQLIAVASHCFVELGKLRREPVRVLVCAHQQATADNLVDKYFGPMLDHQPEDFELIRVTSNHSFPPRESKFGNYYTTARGVGEISRSPFLIIATTFLTAPSLKRFRAGFFTHILMDEGSQSREPEAIYPLSLASSNTKLVIAGDSCQVSSELNYHCISCNSSLAKYIFQPCVCTC